MQPVKFDFSQVNEEEKGADLQNAKKQAALKARSEPATIEHED